MQNKDFEIVIVEDDALVSLDLVDRLELLGFRNIKLFDKGEDLIAKIGSIQPAVILMDIELAGELDGIDTVITIRRQHKVPVIFLTDHVDDATFHRALSTSPAAFLHKPFIDKQIAQNIEIAVSQEAEELAAKDASVLVPDGLFAFKGEGHFHKVSFKEIHYLKASRAYCEIGISNNQILTISRNMKKVLELLKKSKDADQFVQVHRSYVVNANCITGFNGRNLIIGEQSIPTTDSFIPDLKSRFFTV